MENPSIPRVATWTWSDVITAYHIISRVLLRQTLEQLSQRKDSKYFKNIIIKDIPWGQITPLPLNFPEDFKKKYPFDFIAEFSTLGCNLLKCYKHDYEKSCRGHEPFIINHSIGVCPEACYKVFDEFNQFIFDRFEMKSQNDKGREMMFETYSMEKPDETGVGPNQYYCGMQLVDLKRLAILPSARWNMKYNSNSPSPSSTYLTNEHFRELFEHKPTKLCDVAGLVDSPPLDWNVQMQNVNFNQTYCERFRKTYDPSTDTCLKGAHRKALGFIFGDNVINQLSETELLIPISLVLRAFESTKINPGYIEEAVSQEHYERNFFVDESDKIIQPNEMISITKPRLSYQFNSIDSFNHYRSLIAESIGITFGKAMLFLILAMGEEALIEEGITSSATFLAFLMKNYSKSFIKKLQSVVNATTGPIRAGLRILLVTVRAVLTEVWVQLALKAFAVLKSLTGVLGGIGLITLIPDILLQRYNVGGYNKELTREQLDAVRNQNFKMILKNMSFNGQDEISYMAPLSYISITDNKGNEFISPLVTPEFIYNICLVNFHSNFSEEDVNKMGRTGIKPEMEFELLEEYLFALEVNSIGQRLDGWKDVETNEFTITHAVASIIDSEKEGDVPTEAVKAFDIASEIIRNEVEKHCSAFRDIDLKSTQMKYQLIGKNYDLAVLALVAVLALILSYVSYDFLCHYCSKYYKNYRNKLQSGIIGLIFFLSLWFWIFYFGKPIEKENR